MDICHAKSHNDHLIEQNVNVAYLQKWWTNIQKKAIAKVVNIL